MALHRILADLFVWFRANLQVRPRGGTQHEER